MVKAKKVVIGSLPTQYGTTPLKRVVSLYCKVFYSKYGFYPTVSYPRLAGVLRGTIGSFTEYQIALMVLLHFEWRGADGGDEFIYKRLLDNAFPLEWLPRNINSYQAYIRNTLNIKFDDIVEVEKYVNDTLKGILKV